MEVRHVETLATIIDCPLVWLGIREDGKFIVAVALAGDAPHDYMCVQIPEKEVANLYGKTTSIISKLGRLQREPEVKEWYVINADSFGLLDDMVLEPINFKDIPNGWFYDI